MVGIVAGDFGCADSSDFDRLFMVSGMNPYAGGSGPWNVDWLRAPERRVERGDAPAELTARYPEDGSTQVLRPHVAH